MHDESTPGPAEQEDRLDLTVMVLLLDRDQPWPCSEFELALELSADPADSLARLHGAGLINRLHLYVWPTRAAVKAQQLGL